MFFFLNLRVSQLRSWVFVELGIKRDNRADQVEGSVVKSIL